MPYRVFMIPARDDGAMAQELNRFLASHQVQAVSRRFVEHGMNSYWMFCVDYLPAGTPPPSQGRGAAARGKIDYRERLSPEDFQKFSQLRELRKQIAAADAVPVYTIFWISGGRTRPLFRSCPILVAQDKTAAEAAAS